MMFDPNAMKYIAAAAHDVGAGGQKYANGLPSPCMSVCQMDAASGLCQGCLRTLPEIGAWGQADETFKRQVWSAIAQRVRSRLPEGADAPGQS